MATDLAPTIPDTASAPATVTTDGLTVTNRPIADLIAADLYAKASQALTKKAFGIRFLKQTHPGPIGRYGNSGNAITDDSDQFNVGNND